MYALKSVDQDWVNIFYRPDGKNVLELILKDIVSLSFVDTAILMALKLSRGWIDLFIVYQRGKIVLKACHSLW